jgi:hypothetical protein
MKKLIAFIVMIGLSLPVISQISPYLEFGKGGLVLSASGEQGNSFKGCVGKVGGSIKGIIDLEATVNYDSYDRIAEGILGDDATSLGWNGTATWWLLRKQASPAVDVNFGLDCGGFYYTFSNYQYIHQEDGNTVDYNGYIGGFVGIDTRLKFRMDNNWSLLPGYTLVYYAGQDKSVELNQTTTETFAGIQSILGVSLAKSLNKGNIIYFSAQQWFDTFEATSFFDLSIGFIFAQK